MKTIAFDSVTKEYGEFSNFAPYPIRLDGKTWPTVEHYFQAQKFDDDAQRERIRAANSPLQAARSGRDRTQRIRRDWESAKLGVMRKALLAKFTQHRELGLLLLATGTAPLVEKSERDAYWAQGPDGRGKNMLGRTLMAVREELRYSLPSTADAQLQFIDIK